jgi:hypothetical protein
LGSCEFRTHPRLQVPAFSIKNQLSTFAVSSTIQRLLAVLPQFSDASKRGL